MKVYQPVEFDSGKRNFTVAQSHNARVRNSASKTASNFTDGNCFWFINIFTVIFQLYPIIQFSLRTNYHLPE